MTRDQVIQMRSRAADNPRPDGLPILMTTGEVAVMLHVNASTVCRWRQTGSGPRVTWLSRSMPRYQHKDVMAWIERMAS